MTVSEEMLAAGWKAKPRFMNIDSAELSAIYLAMKAAEPLPQRDEVERLIDELVLASWQEGGPSNIARLEKAKANIRAALVREPLQQGDDLRERFASLESGLVMLHRATQEADPHRELTIRVEDALAELRAIIAPLTAIESHSG